MRKRTVYGSLVNAEPTAEPAKILRWEARDEWGADLRRTFAAPAAAAAAELAVELLLERGEAGEGHNAVEVRTLCGTWIRVAVYVWLTVEATVSAAHVELVTATKERANA